MSASHQTPHHVRAHPTQTDHSKLHAEASVDPMIRRPLCQGLVDRRIERAQAGGDVGSDVNPERAPVALRQDLKVTACLRRLDETERVPADPARRHT
jgi:hypothetical protein